MAAALDDDVEVGGHFSRCGVVALSYQSAAVQLSVQAAVAPAATYAFSPLLGDALRDISASVMSVMP